MVPKLHKKGTSFKGAAAYLLHDKGSRETNARVEWTETRNLATKNPEAAWRVMAATAMDQERMKKAAGVKATGRKSKDAVLHLTLSWHPTEKVSRSEMSATADQALKSLGAEGRQVVLVCHNDEPHPHVHLLINRVSSQDGKMLSSSKEKLALSKWAEQYEKSRGSIVCPERVKNNARREGREYVRASKEKSRPEINEAKSRSTLSATVRGEQKRKDAELAKATREMVTRHKAQWNALEERQRQESGSLRHKVRELMPRYKLKIERVYLDRQSMHKEKQRKELAQFCRDEKTVLGRMAHRLQSIDFKALLANRDGERAALREAFLCVVSSEARVQAFKEKQRRETKELKAERAAAVTRGDWRIFAGWRVRKVKARTSHAQERATLWQKQQEEKTLNRQAWQERQTKRHAAFAALSPAEQYRMERAAAKERSLNDENHAKRLRRRR